MDRSKWEYKKLGEVATFERGLTYSKGDEADFSSNGVLRSNNIDLDTHQLVFDEIKYLNPNFAIPESKKLKKDSIFICMSNGSKAHLGKVAFADKDYDYAFGGFMGMIVPQNIFPKYLFYYFLSHNYRNGLEQIGKGANINNLRFAQLAEFKVPTPPMEDQQRIVAELDCLNEMIALKQEQLKEFDKLAQSIFYDMFGDLYNTTYPISTLNDLCEFIKDGTHQTPTYTDDIENGVKFLSAKDVVGGYINWSGIKHIPYELHKELHKRIAPRRNDLLLCKNGTTGICAIVETDEVFDIYVSLALLRPKSPFCPKYLLYAINNPLTKKQFDESLKGVGVPNLHLGEIKKVRIINPPLSIQQQFAEKISAIEAQKELVKQSIAETQSLFNSRMDYFFN